MEIEGPGRTAVLGRVLLVVLVPFSLLLVVALGIAVATDTPASDLLRDPSAVLDGPWYVGLFSTTGGMLWFSAAALGLIALSLDIPDHFRPLLRAGAITSLIMGADDVYLIHETVKNDIGMPSPVTIGIYGMVALSLFFVARRAVLASPNVAVLATALLLLGSSVLLDFAGEAHLPTPPFSAIIEDVAKFVGIVAWATFMGIEAHRALATRAGKVDDPLEASGVTAPQQM